MRGRKRENDEGGEEREKREQPGWRHGGTGSAMRDSNMRDTLRSPTVRLIRSGLPCVRGGPRVGEVLRMLHRRALKLHCCAMQRRAVRTLLTYAQCTSVRR